ncbi:Glycosyl hydrolases family 2, TIM barrel domain [Poriferisphaera corsica]|uniref:Glycosyl hydrolases family 2, TIM barrel domain n=1 Tax=Poriferisphaera corsica TaxID=2528020 RepID=A0A517YTC4_9BACT|nr:glycoside hydrolase family 2 TIM barrel-domain containing protein [Poriferisphaera corsica]QDU33478.1 Glycosyl hydrolases family 2, TIM barrel domain [Poriferisphaera corsica]
MFRFARTISVVASLLLTLLLNVTLNAEPSSTKLEKNGKFWSLIHNGKPYRIKGAGGQVYLEQVIQAGGNSIRTWGVNDNTQNILDDAFAKNITVTFGIWLGHERHGFDYSDPDKVKKQIDKVENAVLKYKDHPALLIWGLGNEMEWKNNNPDVYKAVNDIAKRVKQLDPNHPTMTVIAELGKNGSKINALNKYCPDIDIIGINTYGGVNTVLNRYRKAGGTRPVIITEYAGPRDKESKKTSWDAPIEDTSTQKAHDYYNGYKNTVLSNPDLTLGSYAFKWGEKQQTTATWVGMFLPDGTRLAPVDTMTQLWSGKPPKNKCPKITKLKLLGEDIAKPNQYITVLLKAHDPDDDPLQIEWILRAADGKTKDGGDYEQLNAIHTIKPERISDTIVRIKMPHAQRPYRLFVYIRDGQGNGAVGNIPLLVKALK